MDPESKDICARSEFPCDFNVTENLKMLEKEMLGEYPKKKKSPPPKPQDILNQRRILSQKRLDLKDKIKKLKVRQEFAVKPSKRKEDKIMSVIPENIK